MLPHLCELTERSTLEQVLYGVNGFLSMVSDNVFVATIFIESVAAAAEEGFSDAANMTRAHFEDLAVAINMGTNLPSCATPNGQAAFLFILTSAVSSLPVPDKNWASWHSTALSVTCRGHLCTSARTAPSLARSCMPYLLCARQVSPMVDLSYFKMVMMTMPYTIMLTCAGLAGILTMDYHK